MGREQLSDVLRAAKKSLDQAGIRRHSGFSNRH